MSPWQLVLTLSTLFMLTHLYVRICIFLTCRKHLYDHIISLKQEVWASKTSLTLPLLIEVPVTNQNVSSHDMCIRGIDLASCLYNFLVYILDCSDVTAKKTFFILSSWITRHVHDQINHYKYYMTSDNVFSDWLTSLVTIFDKNIIFTSHDVRRSELITFIHIVWRNASWI